MNNKRIYNVAQPNGDNQPATEIWSENKFLDKSRGVMAGPLDVSNNKITNLVKPTNSNKALNMSGFETIILTFTSEQEIFTKNFMVVRSDLIPQ